MANNPIGRLSQQLRLLSSQPPMASRKSPLRRRRRRHARPTLHRLPPVHALRPQPKQPINHSRSLQRAALAIDQLRLCSWRDGDRATERRGGRDDACAGWRGGAGGYGGCCVR